MAQKILQASSRPLCRGIQKFLQVFPVQGHLLKAQRQYSNKNYKNRTLSLSSILLQDGLDFTELPIFIRKLDPSCFPHENNQFVPTVKKMTKDEKLFREQLHICSSVKEVFCHLEVPSDVITGYTAAFALQKICYLQNSQNEEEGIDSFIQTAVMNELYEIVKKEVTTLSNETLFCLFKCTFQSVNAIIGSNEFLFEEIENELVLANFQSVSSVTLAVWLPFSHSRLLLTLVGFILVIVMKRSTRTIVTWFFVVSQARRQNF